MAAEWAVPLNASGLVRAAAMAPAAAGMTATETAITAAKIVRAIPTACVPRCQLEVLGEMPFARHKA